MGYLSKRDKEAIRRGAWCNDTSIPAHLRVPNPKHLVIGTIVNGVFVAKQDQSAVTKAIIQK